MHNHWSIKLIILAFMASIVFALGSGLYYILFQKNKPEEAARALTARIGLSLFLFALLMVAYLMGWLKPHALLPTTTNIPTQTEITKPHPQSANTRPPLQNQNGAPD